MVNRIGIFRLTGRAAILATVAAVALSTVAPTGVNAAPAASGVSQHGTGAATDISSAGRRHSRGGGNAAGLAAFGAIVGTIGAIAASQNRHDYYYDRGPGYYGGGPGYYSGGPSYYGGGPAYYGGYGGYRGYGGGHGYDNSRNQTW